MPFLSSFVYSVKSVFENNLPAHVGDETQLSEAHGNAESYARRRRAYAGILDTNSLQMLEEKRDMFYLLSFILHNTKPVGHQVSTMSTTAKLLHVLVSGLSDVSLHAVILIKFFFKLFAGSCWLSNLDATFRRF